MSGTDGCRCSVSQQCQDCRPWATHASGTEGEWQALVTASASGAVQPGQTSVTSQGTAAIAQGHTERQKTSAAFFQGPGPA